MSINLKVDKSTHDGLRRVVTEKSDLDSVTFHSHDWTRKESWCEKATRVVDEVATHNDPPGGYTEYQIVNFPMVDSYHGHITNEDFKSDSGGNSFRVTVKVNDVVKVEQDPHYASGGDFTVNYKTGKVTFLSALTAPDVVKVTYHYVSSSVATVKPEAGKVLRIEVVEVQFSTDIDLKDTAVFQPYGYVDVFAPHLSPSPFPPGTLIPLGNPIRYKTMKDYMNDAFRSYPAYPAMGGAGWRGIPTPVLVMDWDYTRAKPLYAAYGMEIRCFLEHDTEFGGTYATATFYCSIEDES
jgi:hypothetical protein